MTKIITERMRRYKGPDPSHPERTTTLRDCSKCGKPKKPCNLTVHWKEGMIGDFLNGREFLCPRCERGYTHGERGLKEWDRIHQPFDPNKPISKTNRIYDDPLRSGKTRCPYCGEIYTLPEGWLRRSDSSRITCPECKETIKWTGQNILIRRSKQVKTVGDSWDDPDLGKPIP